VVVLGATGFIGRWVARSLVAAGAEVHAAARDRSAAHAAFPDLGALAGLHSLDLTDARSLRRLLGMVRPAIVFNLAGYGVDRAERDEAVAAAVNEGAVRALVEALPGSADRSWRAQQLVHAGSALEYGEATGNLDERDTMPRPTTVYGRTKLAGTMAITESASRLGLRALTARLFTVYGPGEHAGRLLPTMMAARTHRDPLPMTSGEQRRDFTYVGEVVEGLLRLGVARADPGAVINLATGRLTSVREFVERAARVLEISPERLRFGALPTRPEEMRHEPVTLRRLLSLTGWVPSCEIEEGVRRTLTESDQAPS
jgi:nucleoside-diphosphate-sugar epimerase